MTVVVWVGYPDAQQPMKTEYNGGPVAGGTYPGPDLARLHDGRARDPTEKEAGREEGQPGEIQTSTEDAITEPVERCPVRGGGRSGKAVDAEVVDEAPVEEAPVEQEPVEEPAPAPDGGGGDGNSGIDDGFIE